MTGRARIRSLAVFALLIAIYFAAGKFGLMLAFLHPSATPVWPPSGIALVALLVLGIPYWPAIFAGALLVNLTTAGNLATSLGIATGNTLEAVLGALLVKRTAGGMAVFDQPSDVIRYVGWAGLLATALAASVGVSSLTMGGFLPPSEIGSVWITWWLGDAGGCLLVAPLLLLWARPSGVEWTRRRALELVLLYVSLTAVGEAVFGGFVRSPLSDYPLAFMTTPFVLWAAFRFGPRETATAMILLATVAVSGTLRGRGLFATPDPNESLVLLQAFLCITGAMALLVAAVVGERRRALAALERQAADLARSNAELEQFAFAASHDMQEPLRTVTNFLQLLEQRYRDRLDQDGRAFIDFAVSGAKRMKHLIDGLLELSRSGETPTPVPTDSERALDRALELLAVSIEESGALVSHGRLPMVMADPAELTKLFQNLIGNSLKFHGPERPEIRVEAARAGEAFVFSVRDNGIGIAPPHFDRVFLLFERLHGVGKYPGAGIGLAQCKKIVERRGGRIWVDSKVGEGATFSFTLKVVDGPAGESEGISPRAASPAGERAVR